MHRVTVRNGKPQFFDSPELAKARADLCAHLEQHSPDAPFEGPLSLAVVWRFRDSKGREGWKDTKPDTDNLQKLLKDCMTRTRFWIDDAQVADEHVCKTWSPWPGIHVIVLPLDNRAIQRRT
jgi:Holliday junction resolvase RusA-like endonuclease